ncbi:MAG TPA: hypothetical protein VI756_21850 [Blastocatellia bacterium]
MAGTLSAHNPSASARGCRDLAWIPDASVHLVVTSQYRDSILPVRGSARADRWYLRQVLGFAARKTLPWAVLFAAVFLARGALDVLLPPPLDERTADFHTRSLLTTYPSIGLLLVAGFWAGWRSGSFFAGVAAGLATVALASALTTAGNVIFLAFWHDAGTMSAIRASGGVGEMFLMPAMLIEAGGALGGIGGLAGAGATRFRHSDKTLRLP